MPELLTSTPVVMSISSHYPSGYAGISTNIETCASLGCHCSPIISKLVANDSSSQKNCQITNTSLLIEQVRAVLDEITVNLFYIGDLASIGNIEAIHTILNDYPDIPMVLHPSLVQYANEPAMNNAIRNMLLPQASIAVLKMRDALALAPGADTLSACSRGLMEFSCDNIFIIGAGGSSTEISNHWFSVRGSGQHYPWERLPYNYHGASETLSAALSAYLAHGLSMSESIQQAQQFTWHALQKGRQISGDVLLPDRLHWCRK